MRRLFSHDVLMDDLWYLAYQLQEPCVLAIPVGPSALILHDYPTNKGSMDT